MNSDAKTFDLVQVLTLLKNSEEILVLGNKSHTHQEKRKHFCLFLTFLFTSNQ